MCAYTHIIYIYIMQRYIDRQTERLPYFFGGDFVVLVSTCTMSRQDQMFDFLFLNLKYYLDFIILYDIHRF